MRTYSKRHRADQNVLNNVVVNVKTDGKGVCHSEIEELPRKRKKIQPAMAGAFETPHPTLEARSEVYKLPSTKPMPSPTPFSPVPITASAHCLDLSTRPVPTTSGTLKENVGSSKTIPQRQSSKTLSSFTLTSGSGPAFRNTRENGKQTRSPSRSSRSRSRDPEISKFKSKLIKRSKFKPNATINDPSKHHSSKPKQTPPFMSKSFDKRNKYVLPISNAEQVLLASPFSSRAPSPTARSNSDFAKSGVNESMGPPAPAEPKLVTHSRRLSKVYVDPSVPSHFHAQNQSFQNKTGRLSHCDFFSSPEKSATRMRSSARLSSRGLGRTNENDFSWKSRRPSAPSSLQRPPKPFGKTHIPEKKTEKVGYKQFKEENRINTSERRNPAPSPFVDHIKDCSNKPSVGSNANPDPFFWMQERSAVDFNRPPSQLSFHLPCGFNNAEDEGEADGVFWSSEDDDDGKDDQLQATKSAWLSSTPYEKVIAKRLSVPILEVPSLLADPPDFTKPSMSVAVGDNDKNGEDMELTIPLECGGDIPENESTSLHEHTPWITDSIISPPTVYSERTKPAINVDEMGVDKNVDKKQYVPEPGLKHQTSPSSSMVPTQAGILSSPFGSSYVESTSSIVESTSMGLHEPTAGGNQERKDEITFTDGTQSQGPSQRTRSGTILAARNGASIARRTRSGTIVGPSTIGRTRSGTIVAKVKVPEQIVAVAGVSGKKGVGSTTSSVTNLEPMLISDVSGADEEVHARLDGELIQIENGWGSSIEEVNEAECYVDSLYLTSSPDPINFLTGAKIDGDESELVVTVGEWQVADEPPSPEMRRTKRRTRTPRGVGGRSATRRVKLKGHRKNRARFLGTDGQVEGYECDDPEGSNPNFGGGLSLSDDELLLVEGQSQSLFS